MVIHYWICCLTKKIIIILFVNFQDTRILMFWFSVIQLVHCNVSGLFPCPGLFSFSVCMDGVSCRNVHFILAVLWLYYCLFCMNITLYTFKYVFRCLVCMDVVVCPDCTFYIGSLLCMYFTLYIFKYSETCLNRTLSICFVA